MKRYLPWILVTTLLFPLIQVIIFFARFGPPEAGLYLESLAFAPIGLLGGLYLFYVYDKAAGGIHQQAIVIGFVLAIPFSLFGSLMGGLFGYAGVLIFGLLLLAPGILLGNWIGDLATRRRS